MGRCGPSDHLRSLNLELIIKTDIANANDDLTAADQRHVAAEKKRDDLQKAIDQLEFNMSTTSAPGSISFEQGLVIGAGVIGTALGTMFIGPVGGAAVASVIPLAGELVGNKGTMKHLGEAAKSSTDLAKSLGVKGDEDFLTTFGLEDLLKDSDEKTKKWTDPAFKMAISLGKFAIEIYKAEAKGDPRYAELKLRSAELLQAVREEMLARQALVVAKRDLAAAEAALRLRDEDIRRLELARTELTDKDDTIRKAVVSAVRDARSTQDLVLRRVFRAARALDVYTVSHPPGASQSSPFADLNSPASLVRYDNGYLHPDVDADYLDRFIDHTAYKTLVQQAYDEVTSLRYDDSHDSYLARPEGLRAGMAVLYPPFEDAEEQATAVAMLRTTGALPFLTDVADLLPYMYEAKVASVRVTLSGVSAPQQQFPCVLTHVGRGQQRWLPAEDADPPVAEQSLPQTIDLIAMEPTGVPGEYAGEAVLTKPGVDQSIQMRCWGRAAATEWNLQVLPGGNVNLTGLTAVAVRIGYDAFPSGIPTGGAVQAVSHPGAAALPGSSLTGRVTLVEPAPAGGAMVAIINTDAGVVKVPGGVTVPAGANTATVPIEITKSAAPGSSAVLTARLGATLRTTIRVAGSDQTTVSVGTQAGLQSAVAGLAVTGGRVYGIHHFRRPDGSQEGSVPGTLLAYETATFGTAAPNKVTVGHLPRSLAVDPARNRAYVLNGGVASLSLTILTLDTLTEVAGSPIKLGSGIADVAVHAGTGQVYVSNGAGLVHVIEADQVTGTIPVGLGPFGLTVNAKLGLLYVARAHRSSLPHVHEMTVVRCADRTVVDQLTSPVCSTPRRWRCSSRPPPAGTWSASAATALPPGRWGWYSPAGAASRSSRYGPGASPPGWRWPAT